MQNDHLQSRIHSVRNQKVMLDFDLATLYEIETKVLNHAVKRHIKRFPFDFMFRLSNDEWNAIRSQFVTASQNKRNVNVTPCAFTEQGIAMLSGILNSDVAINVNIAIMRTFVMIRKFALQHKDFTEKLSELENKYDKQFNDVCEALNYLIKKTIHNCPNANKLVTNHDKNQHFRLRLARISVGGNINF